MSLVEQSAEETAGIARGRRAARRRRIPCQQRRAPPAPTPRPCRSTRRCRVRRASSNIDRAALRALELLAAETRSGSSRRTIARSSVRCIANAMGRGVPELPNGHAHSWWRARCRATARRSRASTSRCRWHWKKTCACCSSTPTSPSRTSAASWASRDEPGLLDVLRDEQRRRRVDDPRHRHSRTVACCRRASASSTATELLASARMEDGRRRSSCARDPNRIVLFDSPPLLLTSESRALASVCGQIVLVVRAGVDAATGGARCAADVGRRPLDRPRAERRTTRIAGAYHGYYGEEPAADQKAP